MDEAEARARLRLLQLQRQRAAGAPAQTPQTGVPGNAAGPPGAGVQPSPAAPTAPTAPPVDDGTAWMTGYKPTDDMSGAQRFLAGAGKAFSDLGTGAKQLYAEATGNVAETERLRAETKATQGRDKALTDTGAGFAGNLTGNVAAALPAVLAAAPASVPMAMAVGAGTGALQGALAPTAQEGERTSNALLGGAVGGAIPGIMPAARSVLGRPDEAVQKAAEVLGRYGVKVGNNRTMPGALSRTSDYLLEKTPIVNNIVRKGAEKDQAKVADALFNMLGTKTPTTNKELGNIVAKIGEEVGAASKGKAVRMKNIVPEVDAAMAKYTKLLPAQQDRTVLAIGQQLRDVAALPNSKLKGESYQAIRSKMSEHMGKVGSNEQQALKTMRNAMDKGFEAALSPEEALAHAANKEKYRLAKALAKVDIKKGEFSLDKARNAVEKAAKKAPVMPAARELLDAAETGLQKIPANVGVPGAALSLGAIANPLLLGKLLVGGAGVRGAVNLGLPKLVNNRLVDSPLARTSTAALLRGYQQTGE